MSFQALNWALKQSLKGNQKFVLVILSYHANHSGECWPGIETIAEEGGMTRSSVIKHLNEITRLGLITKVKRYDVRGYRRSTLYKLDLNHNKESLHKKNRRRDLGSQDQDFDISNVKNLDCNIIESTVEQSIEQSTHEVEISAAQNVFEYWQIVMNHPNAKLDKKREHAITAAIKLGYRVEELKQAIDGCAKTPFNMGENDKHLRFDDIGLILRDASHIDRFISNANLNKLKVTDSSDDFMAGVV